MTRARGLAYRFLAARPRSRSELRAYLERKEVPEIVVEQAVQDMERYGYIDDFKFAAGFARHLRETKGLSLWALKAELRKKGVSPEDIDAALEELLRAGGEDEEAAATRVAMKKMASMKGVDKEKARQRLVENLRRKGFSFDIIRKALSAVNQG